MLVHYLALLCHLALIGPETTAPRTRSTAGEIRISTPARVRCWGPRFCRDLSAEPRRSLDLCRPAAISGAFEAISRLTPRPATRYRSLAQSLPALGVWPK